MEGPKDNFKWFGEGFDGFTKHLPEDSVEYNIYIINSKLSDSETQQQLRRVQNAASKLTEDLLKDFIWQRDCFKLDIRRQRGLRHLSGRTDFGDSVEDEWLIVYILRELSKQFPETWITITDTDGQFLLVEAANALPAWLNPEIAEFRLWMNNGQLCIIPLENEAGGANPGFKPLTLQKAMKYIDANASKLVHLPEIEAEAFHRLQKYPDHISDSIHHSVITIPRKLAYALHQNAAYISPATEAFYLRDPIALRPLQTKAIGSTSFPPTDLVTVSVKFTKIGYAQLKSQRFEPPALWAALCSSQGNEVLQQRLETGMKVTCGFEMLISDSQNQDKKVVREMRMILEDIEQGTEKLPSDDEIASWGRQDDDEKWLDIDFEFFEQELNGTKVKNPLKTSSGFGDERAHDNLRKIVSRFEDFLKDDAAGAEGAEVVDDMDRNDDEDSTLDGESEEDDKNKDIDFDEAAFAKMMKEIMGSPPEPGTHEIPKVMRPFNKVHNKSDTGSSSDDADEQQVRQIAEDIENELREAGALSLKHPHEREGQSDQSKAIIANSTYTDRTAGNAAAGAESENDNVDVDVNLARNLLESFKIQGGVSGPGGNILRSMGMQLPRDEPEEG
ncbi:hypothetical protein MMC21_005731 [Puttea exsequens]|nr:hypothetical protein [Puttea exsequens]